jgi:hypothetical protein
MTEVLTVLIGLMWILALVGVPFGLIVAGCYYNRPHDQSAAAAAWLCLLPWSLIGLIWLCYRVGLTVRPWLVEVLK